MKPFFCGPEELFGDVVKNVECRLYELSAISLRALGDVIKNHDLRMFGQIQINFKAKPKLVLIYVLVCSRMFPYVPVCSRAFPCVLLINCHIEVFFAPANKNVNRCFGTPFQKFH